MQQRTRKDGIYVVEFVQKIMNDSLFVKTAKKGTS
jgi:hypothetical protein